MLFSLLTNVEQSIPLYQTSADFSSPPWDPGFCVNVFYCLILILVPLSLPLRSSKPPHYLLHLSLLWFCTSWPHETMIFMENRSANPQPPIWKMRALCPAIGMFQHCDHLLCLFMQTGWKRSFDHWIHASTWGNKPMVPTPLGSQYLATPSYKALFLPLTYYTGWCTAAKYFTGLCPDVEEICGAQKTHSRMDNVQSPCWWCPMLGLNQGLCSCVAVTACTELLI